MPSIRQFFIGFATMITKKHVKTRKKKSEINSKENTFLHQIHSIVTCHIRSEVYSPELGLQTLNTDGNLTKDLK